MTDNYFLDINVIQPLPPNNVNRDDTGTPKTAVYGGVTRARISSQALKRAVREQFQQRHLPENELGRPTREVEALLTEAIKAKNSDVDAEALAKELWKAIKTTKAKENANSDEGDGKKATWCSSATNRWRPWPTWPSVHKMPLTRRKHVAWRRKPTVWSLPFLAA